MMVSKKFMAGLLGLTLFLHGCGELQAIFNKSPHTAKSAKSVKAAAHSIAPHDQRDADPMSVKSVPAQPVAGEDFNSQRGLISTKKGLYYFVAPGDTVALIAKKLKMPAEQLVYLNKLGPEKLTVGRRFFAPHRKFKKEYLTVADLIEIKRLRKTRKASPVRPQRGQAVKFIWPMKTFRLTSGFGWRRGRPHDGIDLSAPRGTPIYAAAKGQVVYAKRFTSYGNLVVIKHAQDYFTAYSHLQAVDVQQGRKVKQDQQIGTVGTTGRSTGPHLHFELHKREKPLDPTKVLPSR